jgi:predicted restriction endonuclease
MTQITLATAVNPLAARLIRKYQITDKRLEVAKRPRQWTKQLYAEYLQSAHWQTFRLKVLEFYGHKCMLCGADDVPLEIHHNDYSRLGGELLTDVLPLCGECHERHHGGV